jgi:hypothetical protein
MKLRARFPQIGLARADGGMLRRAFWPTSRSGGVEPAAAEAPAAAPTRAPVVTSEFAPPIDWPSTVAAWRSTTGKPGDRS